MRPWQTDSKALPARPDTDFERQPSFQSFHDDHIDERELVLETGGLTKNKRSESYPRSTPPLEVSPELLRQDAYSRGAGLQPPARLFEAGMLQSSFSRSPARQPFLDHASSQRSDEDGPDLLVTSDPPRSPTRNDHPEEAQISQAGLGHRRPVKGSREGEGHSREDSQNSWLDPIDESGGSSASSVHSRTSSHGYRRRHIRGPSRDTELEFDTALDAAIEAAYDDGYEPMQIQHFGDLPDDEVVANALRKVEVARERVRQTEREAYGTASERNMQQWHFRALPQQQKHAQNDTGDFFDDDSSEDGERVLDELSRDLVTDDFSTSKQSRTQQIPQDSDSSGGTTRTWPSSGSNPPAEATSLTTVTGKLIVPNILSSASNAMRRPPPPPTAMLPELPLQRPPSSSAQSVRSRRMSGPNTKPLKIETAQLPKPENSRPPEEVQPKSALVPMEESSTQAMEDLKSASVLRLPSSPLVDAGSSDFLPLASPFGFHGAEETGESQAGRSASPSLTKIRKNFSSSSLRSLKSRNQSLSNLDESLDISPETPSSSQFTSQRAPAVPALPTPFTASFREKLEVSSTGNWCLFDNNFHAPDTPGTPNPMFTDAPVPLEPCPRDFMLRPFWLMRCIYQTLVHPRGGYLSTRLFVPRDVWRVRGVKLKNVEEKIANCDFLTAALLKLIKVDTCDADAVLEEMQALEGVLEQVQNALSRKLGSEVGLQGSGSAFKEASNVADAELSGNVPRSSSVSGKSSSFSWRRLKSKNSTTALGGSYNARAGLGDNGRDSATWASLPMTANPTNRPAKRDLAQVQFTGPNANYASSLARLFDAAQAIGESPV